MSGCGREEKTDQEAQVQSETPRGRITAVMASPSGMLWMASARVMASPSDSPPPNDTPTATPSAQESTAITTRNSSARRALTPVSAPMPGSGCPRSRWVMRMKAIPRAAPTKVRLGLWCTPSASSPRLAPSMRPAAVALATAAPRGERRRMKAKGTAPRPVARAVTRAARKTAQTIGSPNAEVTGHRP